MTSYDIALAYIKRGWAPIPVPFKAKGPVLNGWPGLRLTADSVGDYFDHSPKNIGVLLGEPSAMLIDIDLDSPEALEFAESILPPTATFGRVSTPRSHWLYIAQVVNNIKLKDPLAKEKGHKETLLEVRTTGSQTVFPGSVHPGGENIEWSHNTNPTIIPADELVVRARYLAAVCLLKRYWPGEGARHDAATALIGLLARAGMQDQLIARFVTAINGGESLRKHQGLARDAVARVQDDRPVPGIPKVRAIFGEKLTQLILEWLGLVHPKLTAADVHAAAANLSRESASSDISTVIGLLRSARLGELETEDLLLHIAARTGKGISALRNEFRSHRKERNGQSSQAKELVEIGKQAELFYDEENGEAFAGIQRDDHTENLRLRGRPFREWLARAQHEKTGAVPDKTAIDNAVTVLSGLATINGERHRTWLRVACDDNAIYVDLGDSSWRVVRITSAGWEIIANPPVRFRRAGALALREPERGGSIQDFRPFVNADDQGFMLIVGVTLNAFRPDKPFPILQLAGEKGTAKSTLLVLLRLLIDPAPAAGAGLSGRQPRCG